MSWVRWGSPCWASIPKYECNERCENCPGSSVYVYEDTEDKIVCCGDDFKCDTEAEMVAHLKEHKAKGDHVRPSLILSDEEKGEGRMPSPGEMMDDMRRSYDRYNGKLRESRGEGT